MPWDWLEPLRAYWARQRLERLQCEAAARLYTETAGPQRVVDEPDAARWRLLYAGPKEERMGDPETLRQRARHLADHNPHARNVLTLYRNYVVGGGMRHEITGADAASVTLVRRLWREFRVANDWDQGNRKDWEFCTRVWRDGECFLRLFHQPVWPPRIHFIDPERIGPDPRTGLPVQGIATAPENVEIPLSYCVLGSEPGSSPEHVPAARVLHTKIGVDGNVRRGVTLFLPVLDALQRFQGWLDVELIQRKVASSVVLVRKHTAGYPSGISGFADAAADQPGRVPRRLTLQPGTIVDAQGFDLEFLSPNTHFADASLLGRTILLAIAAGTGLPEFMLSADASNANLASTLVAEGPAVRGFAAWQAFFIGQWQRLFDLVLREAVALGYLTAPAAATVELRMFPPPLAVRDRHKEAAADAVYFDRGVLSRRELARRDHADPEQMALERAAEAAG